MNNLLNKKMCIRDRSHTYDIVIGAMADDQIYNYVSDEMLCKAAGIQVIYVASEEMNHGWNAVRLGGTTYYIDCTFDDPIPDRGEYVSDQYFMLTGDELAQTHTWNEAFYEQLLDSLEQGGK